MNYRIGQEDVKALLRPFVDNKTKLIFEKGKHFIAKQTSFQEG